MYTYITKSIIFIFPDLNSHIKKVDIDAKITFRNVLSLHGYEDNHYQSDSNKYPNHCE